MDAGNQYAAVRRLLSEDLVEVFIRVGLIALLIFVCVRIFAPFATLMLWGLILAVALYPLCRRIAARLGGRTKLAAAIVVLIALLVIGVPTAVLGSLFAGQIHAGYEANTVLLIQEMIEHFQRAPGDVLPGMSLILIPAANPDGLTRGRAAVSRLMQVVASAK